MVASELEVASGQLTFRPAEAETFELASGGEPFDLAFATRVGALDGRYPEAGKQARRCIAAARKLSGRLFIGGGDPLREVWLDNRIPSTEGPVQVRFGHFMSGVPSRTLLDDRP
jgi:hypothetical protein